MNGMVGMCGAFVAVTWLVRWLEPIPTPEGIGAVAAIGFAFGWEFKSLQR